MLHKGWKVETTQMSISCWMDKQFVVETTTICGLAIQWILFGHKKKEALIHATTWMNLENMLSEWSQT